LYYAFDNISARVQMILLVLILPVVKDWRRAVLKIAILKMMELHFRRLVVSYFMHSEFQWFTLIWWSNLQKIGSDFSSQCY